MADPATFCGTCPSIGTCPDCVRRELGQNEEGDISVCCNEQSLLSSAFSSSTHTFPASRLMEEGLGGTSSQVPSTTQTNTTPDSLSFSSSLPPLKSSAETSASPFVTRPIEPLNVAAIVIGAIGAALLVVCVATTIFCLRKKRQKKKSPASAEFMAVVWQNRTYHEMDSPTSFTFTPKDNRSIASSHYDSLEFGLCALPYTPPPTTPS